MRSLLFVPADSPRKLEQALTSGADTLIVDLAGAASERARAAARDFVTKAAKKPGGPRLFVRVSALDSGHADGDLDAIMTAGPEAIVLPRASAGADVQHLGIKLAVREAEYGLADGTTGIVAIATGTAASIFAMSSYAGSSRRLLGLAWSAEDLAADLGATSRLDDGSYTPPCLLARTLTLFAAAASAIESIDTNSPEIDDLERLRVECEAAYRDGFTAKLAIDPRQVPVINESFTPSPAAIARARQIVAAFAAEPSARVISIGDEMLDRTHLKRAERTLAQRL